MDAADHSDRLLTVIIVVRLR